MGVKDIFTNRRFWVIAALSIIFIIIAVYTYRTYILPKTNYVANKEFTSNGEADNIDSAELYFFYTEWCPHCKTSKPIWNDLQKDIGTNKVKGKRIHFIAVDCDKEPETAAKYKVEGYPTIKLVVGNQVIEYDAKPEFETLKQFLNVSL
jgi:thiol-disulfide isomerase/thioredoxin